jgi:hypothetical protein
MRKIILILVFFYSCSVNQKENKSDSIKKVFKSGTLLIAGIAKDGIVIAADSRLTQSMIVNGNVQTISYQDSCQKIFLLKQTPFAAAGRFTLNNEAFSEIATRYNESTRISSKADFLEPANFFIWVFSDKYPLLPGQGLSLFLTGGYIDDTPQIKRIIPINHGRIELVAKEKGILSSNDSAIFIYQKYIEDTSKMLTCKKMAKVFERTIIEWGKNNVTVGGPVSIIRIKKDNSHEWIKNDFSTNPLGGNINLIPVKDTAIWNSQIRLSLQAIAH